MCYRFFFCIFKSSIPSITRRLGRLVMLGISSRAYLYIVQYEVTSSEKQNSLCELVDSPRMAELR